MPGPHNAKKKKRAQQRKKHRTNSKTHSSTSSTITQTTQSTVSDLSSPTLVTSLTSPASDVHGTENLRKDYCEGVHWLAQDTPSLPASPYGPIDDPTLLLLSNPIIHDPGNGPRVRNMGAFLNSSFSQPVSTADPLCAEFSRCEILQMLRTVLPEETALCLWYNKSRRIGRVCPACLRLYTLMDAPPDVSTRLLSEQIISGLCSPICFMLAAHRSPVAAKVAWGRMAEDLDDATWELLDESRPPPITSTGMVPAEAGVGLGMLLKMTRLHDLGLAQLCMPDLVAD